MTAMFPGGHECSELSLDLSGHDSQMYIDRYFLKIPENYFKSINIKYGGHFH